MTGRTDRRQNIFVVGLDDFHARDLERIPDRERFNFHGLLEADEVVFRDNYDIEAKLEEASRILDDIDLTVRASTVEWYRSRADAFDSVLGETRTEREFRRGGWRALARTRTVLTSTPTHFHLRAELDAFEGDTRIFSENWEREIERDLL